jgi:hypothetical protein
MNRALQNKLRHLRNDYREVNGKPFDYFFCPILYRDENTGLCKAHIENKAFLGSSPNWTIQRTDVDNFYGAHFEADIIDIQYNEGGVPENILVDKTLSKRFNPKISVDGNNVDFFAAKRNVPNHFTPVIFESKDKEILLGLKMSPGDFHILSDGVWEIEVSKDIRISAIVSLLKAAHLTLFEMIGYRYVFSGGGQFLGGEILGKFYVENSQNPKPLILANAHEFFRRFVHMVRPVETEINGLKGTISDKTLYLCGNKGSYWASIVLIRTSKKLNAVMVPIIESETSWLKFQEFLQNSDEMIEVSRCQFANNHWIVESTSTVLTWPKTGILYP